MGFASDDDYDDIYVSKRSLKDLQTWLEKDFGTIINIKIILLIYSITDINQSLRESGGIPIHQLFYLND